MSGNLIGVTRLTPAPIDQTLEGAWQVGHARIPRIKHQTQVLCDTRRLHEVLDLDVARERDVDPVLGRGHAIQ